MIRRVHAVAVMSLLVLMAGVQPSPAQQHRPGYDGRWVANVPPQGRCPASRLTLDVRGARISGAAANPFGIFPIAGSIDAAGRGTIQIVQMGGRIRFSGARFVADYFNTCGARHAVGLRISAPRRAEAI